MRCLIRSLMRGRYALGYDPRRSSSGRGALRRDTLFNERSACVKTIRGAYWQEEAYEYGEATDRPCLPIERSKVLERPSSTLARSLRFTRTSPDRQIRRPLRPQWHGTWEYKSAAITRGPYVTTSRISSPPASMRMCALGLDSKVGSVRIRQ
jgi:hypothetical protein